MQQFSPPRQESNPHQCLRRALLYPLSYEGQIEIYLFFDIIIIMNKEKKKSIESAIAWQAPEFEYQPKDVSWYWLSLIVGIILIALAVWQKNFLFMVFVVIAWLVITVMANRFPTVWEFKIDEEGISIVLPNEKSGGKFYPYTEIEGFNIHSGGEDYKELVLKTKSKLSPYLKINIHGADEEKIKDFLLKFLPKEEYNQSLADSFSKLIRF